MSDTENLTKPSATQPVIAFDLMGGDFGPQNTIPAIQEAIGKYGCKIIAVGSEQTCNNLLSSLTADQKKLVEVEYSYQEITMNDSASAVKSKPTSAIVVCARLVAEGRANAMVGAGNTGAMMSAAVLHMGRLKGVKRPGIAIPVPVPAGVYSDANMFQLLVDGGATVDCDPKWLYQFAVMAKSYAQHRLGIENPTIGLLSNGEEPEKGDQLRKKTYELLKDMEGFVGNCEGKDLTTGEPNIVITDGFTGNIALKTMEGTFKSVAKLIMATLTANEEIAKAAEPVFQSLMEAAEKVHPDQVGGCLLLGVDGNCVITHGSSNVHALVNAIKVAKECVETEVQEYLAQAIHDN